jgi:hypothetical protein
MNQYELLTGVGRLYVAPVGTAFPALSATPAGSWVDVGETRDGVTITHEQTIEEAQCDQILGPLKAFRTDEALGVQTNLVCANLERMADLLGATVADTPPGSGTIGSREVHLHCGDTVKEYALLFRGDSPYGAYPAQYEVPRGYFRDAMTLNHRKGETVTLPANFRALVDLTASNDEDRFGRLVAQDATAL